MSKITFLNARLVDPEQDEIVIGGLVVEEGRITKHLPKDAPRLTSGRVIDCGLNYLAPGIVDLGVKVCEPGDRHKESYRSAGLGHGAQQGQAAGDVGAFTWCRAHVEGAPEGVAVIGIPAPSTASAPPTAAATRRPPTRARSFITISIVHRAARRVHQDTTPN